MRSNFSDHSFGAPSDLAAFPVLGDGHRFVQRRSAARFFCGPTARVAGLVVHEAGVQRRLAVFRVFALGLGLLALSELAPYISVGRNCQYSNLSARRLPCSPPDRPITPLMGTLGTPVRAHRSLASKRLMQMALSRITRENFNAEWIIHPAFPAFTGVGVTARRRSDRAPRGGLGERQRRDPFEADEGGPSPERRHGLSAGAWSGYAAFSPP
jgi:hypothetical protein